jgi:signal transduction histidine kinase
MRIHRWCLAMVLAISVLTLLVDALVLRFRGQSIWEAARVETLLIGAMGLACVYFSKAACKLAEANGVMVGDFRAQTRLLADKNEQLSRLKLLSENLINQVDLTKALDLALEMAVDVIGARAASIMLIDPVAGELRIAAARGLREEVVKNARVKIGEGLAGMVASEGEALVIDSDHLDDRIAPHAKRTHEIRSAIIAPIKMEGVVRGVINVSDKHGGEKWDEEDLAVVSTLAGQAAMVLQKIELYEDLQRQVVKLEEALNQLKKTQAELVQSEKLASIGQIAGGVAHEINNPLLVILGRTEFALDKMTSDHPAHKDLEVVHSMTERIAEIVRNLLSFSRNNEGLDFREVDVNDVLERTLALTERQMSKSNIALIRALDSSLPKVLGNPGQLQQVFLNIAINASQAMTGTGGTLTVSTWHNEEQIYVRFRDTGPGIAAEDLERIFEPFFTTKDETEGTGLGLAISAKLIHSHGGKIEAGGEPGAGAIFTIDLPAMEQQAGQLEGHISEPKHDNGSGRREGDTRAVS